jgi:5-methylcytosine-specific restriction endonuclease McrA
MSTAAAIRQMLENGLSIDQALTAVEAVEDNMGMKSAKPERTAGRQPYWVWQETRNQVFLRDGFECSYCPAVGDESSMTVDHIVPVSRGGGHGLDNLCVACKPCNSSKSGRLLSEWEGRYGARQ